MNSNNSQSLKDELTEKTISLLYPDEDGYPVSVHSISGSENPIYLMFQLSGAEGEVTISEFSINEFFKEPFSRLSSVGPSESLYQNFKTLKDFVKSHFSNIRVFHIGDVKKEVFLLGSTKEGDYVILSTRMLVYPLHLVKDF